MRAAAFSAEAENVRLIGFCDLQDRESLQIVLKGSHAYIGHHRGEKKNPLTGRSEPNGTTIVEVSDPVHPVILKHIPGRGGAEIRAVQVAEKFLDGKDYLLGNQEAGDFTGPTGTAMGCTSSNIRERGDLCGEGRGKKGWG